ncbi:MAG: rod shape-determining protein RodA [Rickettsiales bacterium]|nr:rod shape-determining protein RodA [Rickettsiales bacterium]
MEYKSNYLENQEKLFDFSRILKADPIIVLTTFLLSVFGFVVLYSAGGGDFHAFAFRQLKRFVLILPLVLLIISVNTKLLFKYTYLSYFLGLLLLVIAEISGSTVLGAKRWVSIAGFNIQPSEVMKLAIILTLAKFFHNTHIYNMKKLMYVFLPVAYIALPCILILAQPDLGTTLILFTTGISIMFCAGINMWFFIYSAIGALSMMPIIWVNLKSYQQQRVLTFLNPDTDPLGTGYNIIQSKIAVGSGGLLGKGFLSGTQSHLSFLPESETDFIFTIIAEEFGFVGALILITLFMIYFLRSLNLAAKCRHQFGKLIILGISVFLFLHFFINISMVIGLIPVVGAPLPFFSYGGTMMLTVLIGTALILNMDINKREFIDSVATQH